MANTKKINMIGKKFGRLTVLSECEKRAKNGKIIYKCRCDCGNITDVIGDNLRRGNTMSCGCLHSEVTKTHGLRDCKLYNVWDNAKRRCYNKNNKRYKNYGARGIKICDEWKDNFQSFYDWSMSRGYKQGLTLDRIDVNGNYEPSNCRWITNEEQQNNRTDNVLITYKYRTQNITQWARELNVSPRVIRYRLKKGWPIKDCLFKPINK